MIITEEKLRRTIRRILRESSQSVTDLPEDTILLVQTDEKGGLVEYAPAIGFTKESVSGYLEWHSFSNKPSEIIMSNADAGWGPMLYDIAMELSAPLGIMSDRWTVSASARNVWNYYRDRRPDVKVVQYDNHDNELTPQDDDNLDQAAASFDPTSKPWYNSALSKAYVSKGTPTINALKQKGKIEFKQWVDPDKK